MDLLSVVYSFILLTGTGQFVVNEAIEVTPQVYEVDVETMGLYENHRYILLITDGKVTQQVRVPLASTECQNPN